VTNLAALAGARGGALRQPAFSGHVVRLQAVSAGERAQEQRAVAQVHALGQERRQSEARLLSEGPPVRVTDRPRQVKLDLPRMVSQPGPRPGEKPGTVIHRPGQPDMVLKRPENVRPGDRPATPLANPRPGAAPRPPVSPPPGKVVPPAPAIPPHEGRPIPKHEPPKPAAPPRQVVPPQHPPAPPAPRPPAPPPHQAAPPHPLVPPAPPHKKPHQGGAEVLAGQHVSRQRGQHRAARGQLVAGPQVAGGLAGDRHLPDHEGLRALEDGPGRQVVGAQLPEPAERALGAGRGGKAVAVAPLRSYPQPWSRSWDPGRRSSGKDRVIVPSTALVGYSVPLAGFCLTGPSAARQNKSAWVIRWP
jgi:hypothetical protein